VDLTFRTATPDDAPDVAALVQIAYRGDASRAGWTTEADLLDDDRIDEAGVIHKIEAPGAVVVLAHDPAGRLVGCFELAPRDGTAYFGMFAVLPPLQAAGLGRRMLAEGERIASQEWGLATMQMTVLHPREELVAWYERRGFARTGETRPFVHVDLGETVERPDLHFVVLAKVLG
jgi:ribosomal protein S18 acetylase RimI-like enzyme